MNFDDLQKAWQQAPAPGGATIDASLLAEVRKDSRSFAQKVFWRDVREISASFIVAGVFGKVALDAEAEGSTAWPAWVAAALPLLVAAYFLIDRWMMHRRARPQGGTVIEEIERAAAAVRHQIWLLRNVLWWYILPLALCSVMLGLQIILYAPANFPVWGRWIIGALVLLPTGLFDWWVWQLNQKAVREDLEPRLAELEQRRDELRSED
ncbi:hypothetical protein [Actomonas aquatica]|uniref:Uncharacterized protein n=1 Tax=Actomonas aquatica TaxID=2866162 RepID=A0ABZ1CGG0_9BACT|nr:hypothetical protein [Opitutus sp. WL0086]WRQ89355.1 hypothetical protein K1X11_008035 [Opitutus sp. WL0086]